MRRLLMFWIAWSALSIGLGPACLADGDWLTSVFPERAYDFGTVARGSQIRHAFPIVNRTNADIRIADWRTKCGCTDVKVGAQVIPPGTQTTVEATINTTNFQGYKPSGLTLILDRPVFVEVDLNLTCFIRGDIVMNPGQVDFGTLRRSAKLPSASLDLTYAGGRPDWDIVQMKTQTDRVKAVAREVSRTRRRPDPLADHRHAPAGRRQRLPQGPDHARHQRLARPDDPDLGRGQRPERRLRSRRRSSTSVGSGPARPSPAPTSCTSARRRRSA